MSILEKYSRAHLPSSGLVLASIWIAASVAALALTAVSAAHAAPVILHPVAGSHIPMSHVGQANPPYELRFEPEPGAVSYRLDFSGPMGFSVDVDQFTRGEDFHFASLTFPSFAPTGSYQIYLVGLDANGRDLGLPSQPLSVQATRYGAGYLMPSTSQGYTGGTMIVNSVHIPAGVTVWGEYDWTIISLGPVTIDGILFTRRGKDLKIYSAGEIRIAGQVFSGEGTFAHWTRVQGTDPDIVVEAFGIDGEDGGDLVLMAGDADIVIQSGGQVVAGGGGAGGYAEATGADAHSPGQHGGSARAHAGNGGKGGDLILFSGSGSLRVPQPLEPNAILASNGGSGNSGRAVGGRGGAAPGGGMPGLGGSVEQQCGDGGNAGRLFINTLDWDGDGVVTQSELDVVGGGWGGYAHSAADSYTVPGDPGTASTSTPTVCALQPTIAGRTLINEGGNGGDGWRRGRDGGGAGEIGMEGIASGAGGYAQAIAGRGGDLTTLDVADDATFTMVFHAGRGGYASAVGGDGGPNGGFGGPAQATGGDGGEARTLDGRMQRGGDAGDVQVRGGNGQRPMACCGALAGPGLDGGYGGDASAITGRGGDSLGEAGDGGEIRAYTGFAGQGGDGCAPGSGGGDGEIRMIVGDGGVGVLLDGLPGTVIDEVYRGPGSAGFSCCP